MRASPPGRAVALVVAAVQRFTACRGASRGAAVAFYAVFSLAPLLVLATSLMVWLLGDPGANAMLINAVAELIGPTEAQTLQEVLARAPAAARITVARESASGMAIVGALAAVGTTLVGGSVVFVELRAALQSMLGETESRDTWWHLVKVRLLSMGIILGLGFLMAVALLAQMAALVALRWLTGEASVFAPLLRALELLWSWAVMTLLFALLLRWLPDGRLPFRDAFIGGSIAAALFMVGRYGISLYVAHTAVRSTLGAAGSYVMLLIWIYWSCQIFLVGAAFAAVLRHPDRAPGTARRAAAQAASAPGPG